MPLEVRRTELELVIAYGFLIILGERPRRGRSVCRCDRNKSEEDSHGERD
jgi:hypothetical protein